MGEARIEVSIEDGKVRYEPQSWPQLDLGDTVIWSFRGLSRGAIPCLLFTDFPDSDRNQIPFESFTRDGCQLAGRRFNGTSGSYRYRFAIFPDSGRGVAAIQLGYDDDLKAGGLSKRGGPGGGEQEA